MHEGSITIRLAADVAEIERLNRIVRQFGELHELPGRTLYAVNLALDEMVTNVILYGFAETKGEETKGEEIVVRIKVHPPELRCEIVDGGREFDPMQVPSPDIQAPLRDRELGGLGIHLMRALMDEVTYRREHPKNVLTMSKRIR
jgi:serine/threonine-protein kinase RsbW